MVMMKWGGKKWTLSKKTIMSLEKLSMSMGYNTEDNKREPITISIPYTVYKEYGVDVNMEVSAWAFYLGSENGLYIGTERFGPMRMKLVGVDVSDINVTPGGIIQSATLSISLEEVME